MGIITPDTSLAQEFAPLNGTFPARILTADAGTSKKGNPKIVVAFELDVDGKKRSRTAHISVSGEGSINFDRLLRAVKLVEMADQYRDPAYQPKPPFDTDVLVGQELQVIMSERSYTDPTTQQTKRGDEINGYLPL